MTPLISTGDLDCQPVSTQKADILNVMRILCCFHAFIKKILAVT